MFSHEHLEYFNALRGQDVKIIPTFIQSNICYAFDHSNNTVMAPYTDTSGRTQTGITDIGLYLATLEEVTSYRSNILYGVLTAAAAPSVSVTRRFPAQAIIAVNLLAAFVFALSDLRH